MLPLTSLPLSEDLLRRLKNEAREQGFADPAAYVEHLLKLRSVAASAASAPTATPASPQRFAFVDETAAGLPEAEVGTLPTDGAAHVDHYLYGHAKRAAS
jgi:hypothetical protein